MILLIFLVLVGAGVYTAWRLLAPEMYVHLGPPRAFFKWQKSYLIPDVEEQVVPYVPPEQLPAAIDVPVQSEEPLITTEDKLARFESMLAEKNKSIRRLQKELESERSHRLQFDKIKVAMDEEIQRLRVQVKGLKQAKETNHA